MTLDRRRFLYALAAAAATPAVSQFAYAQSYPSRPVRLIVPFPAGGSSDAIARIVAQKLRDHWSKQVIVENIPAGASNVGTAAAAKAPPDGYTMLVVSGSIVVNPTLYLKIPWDPAHDFAPISLVATSAHVLAVHPSVSAKSVKDLVEFLKANPGKYSYASPGAGTTGQMAGELFKLSVGVDLLHVPFNGAPPAIMSTIGGHTPILFAALPTVAANIKDGQLRALAVTGASRSAAFPEVPTMAEAGFPNQESIFPQGILAPAGTPKDIVDLWYREVVRIVALPDVKARLAEFGFEPIASSPEEFGAWIRAEVPRWAKVVHDAKIATIE